MHWSDLWNKLMDIPTTCLSFIMYFILLHSQNTDTLALQAKLDELIEATPGAREELEHLEESSEKEIKDKRI